MNGIGSKMWRWPIVVGVVLYHSASAQVLSLEEALGIAERENPTIEIARQRIAQASSQLNEAKAAHSPVLDLGFDAAATNNALGAFGYILRQRDYESGLDFNDPGSRSNANVYLEARYRLYGGGERSAFVTRSRAKQGATEYDYEATKSDLRFMVTTTYREVQKAEAFVEILDTSIASLRDAHDLARARLEEGVILESDALALEVELAELREQRLATANGYELRRLALAKLLGVKTLKGTLDPLTQARIDDLANVEGFDVATLPEYQAAQNRFDASKARVDQVSADRGPKIDAFARTDYDSEFSADAIEDSWAVGLKASLNLWDGKAKKERVSAAEAESIATQARLRSVDLELNYRYNKAILDLKAAKDRLEVARKTVLLAEKRADLARSRYEEGNYLPADLNDSEQALLSAKARENIAIADCLIGVANVDRAMGKN